MNDDSVISTSDRKFKFTYPVIGVSVKPATNPVDPNNYDVEFLSSFDTTNMESNPTIVGKTRTYNIKLPSAFKPPFANIPHMCWLGVTNEAN